MLPKWFVVRTVTHSSLIVSAPEKDAKPANWKDVLGTMALFGTSLDQVMERQKDKYPGTSCMLHRDLRDADLKIPKFIRVGMDFIILHGISTEGIFRLSGTQNRINEMKEKLNQGQSKKKERCRVCLTFCSRRAGL